MVVLRTKIKCVVLGDSNVGKTSMLINYATNRFPSVCVPSVFDNFAGSLTCGRKKYNLQIIDTMEGEGEDSRRKCYLGTDCFIVCFSIVQPESFTHLQTRWIPEILNFTGHETPIIVVGTHADLRDEDEVVRHLELKGQKPTTTREATARSRSLGAAHYIECSPVMKKRMRKTINDALQSVFYPKDNYKNTGCVLS